MKKLFSHFNCNSDRAIVVTTLVKSVNNFLAYLRNAPVNCTLRIYKIPFPLY
jgi:hypothetical protein